MSGCGETISRVADGLVLGSIRMERPGGLMTAVWLRGHLRLQAHGGGRHLRLDRLTQFDRGVRVCRCSSRQCPLRYVRKAVSECWRLIDDYGCF